jgi:hypothetical protein
MKLAWLCYNNDDEGHLLVKIVFEEPDYWKYNRVARIVYAEIVE